MLGDMQLVRVALALHLDDVRRLRILRLEESDGLVDVDDPLLVEGKHLEVEAQVLLEDVQLAEVRVSFLDRVQLTAHRALVDGDELLLLWQLEHGVRLRDVHPRHVGGGRGSQRRSSRHVRAHLGRELRDALRKVGGHNLEEPSRLPWVLAEHREQDAALDLDDCYRSHGDG